MAVIEGYTFAVDMQDRGVVASLRQMRSAASAMKAEMRAGFETIRQGEGSISAYNFKIEQSERQIENYKNIQKELRGELEKLSKAREKQIEETKKYADANSEEAQKVQRAFDETEKKYASTVRQIENAQHQINKLTQGIEESRKSILQFNTGLARTRTEAQSVKSVMDGYVRSVNSQGNAFRTAKAQVESYKLQHGALINQFRAEVSETNRLQSKVNGLRNSYSQQQAKVNQAVREHGKASSEYRQEAAALAGLSEKITKINSEYAKQIAQALKVRTSINEISRAERSVTDGGISRLSRAMNNLDANARRATSHTREWTQSVRGGLMAASMAFIPLGAAVGGAVKQSVNLQNEWVKVRNYLYTGADSAREARHEVSRLSKIQSDAKKYSDEYGYSQKQIAEQYGELVKRGYTANASIGSMKSMLQAARASGDDYADVVKNVSGAVDAFGLRSNNTSKMLENTNRVTNAMAFSADKTATDFEGMGNAMSYVAGTAHGAGFSIEQTAAAIGTLSNANIEGTRAGTGLRKVINSLLKPTRGAQDALAKYNMSIDDFKTKSGAMKSLPDIMKIINEYTKNLGKADKGAFFKAVFGATGQESAMMLAQNAKELQKLTDQEKDAEKNDYVGKLAKKQMASTQMQLASLKQRLINIGIVMGNSLLPVINQIAKSFGNWIGSKDGQKAMKDFSDSVSNAGRAVGRHSKSILQFVGGFVEGLSGIVKFGGAATKIILNLFSAIGRFTGLSKSSGNLPKHLGELSGALIGMVGAFKLLKSVTNGMSAVRQDIKSALHLDGVTAEQSKIDLENKKLQENIELWKRHNEVSGGSSDIGSNITASTVEKTSKNSEKVPTSTIEEELPSRTKLRHAGEVRGNCVAKGVRGGLVRGLKGTANLVIMTITSGVLDLDMVVALGKKIGQLLLKGFKISWKIGKWITKPFTKLIDSNAVHQIFGFPTKEVAQQGTKVGTNFTQGIKQSLKNAKSKFSISGLFKSTGKHAAHSGKDVGKSFVESASKSVEKSPKKITFTNLFKGSGKHAATSGAKAGTSFVESAGKTATKSSKLLTYGKTLGSKMGGAATVAFGVIDLLQALTTSNHKNRAKKVGESLGSTAGAAGGMAIGATLGSTVPGIGTVIGGTLGSIIGGVAGGHIGKSLGKAWPQIKKGASKAAKGIGKLFQAPFKWAYGQGQKFGKWLNKQFSSKNRKNSKRSNFSTKDLKLIQQMTKAVNGYTRSLKNLQKIKMKNYFNSMAKDIRKSKINKELSSMDKSTRQAARNWKNLAKPIRNVASSFRVLQKSIRTLAGKRNGLTSVDRDIRNLYRTIRKNPFGRLIAQQANIANKAMSGKKSGFVNEFNRQTRSMDRALRSFKREFDRDWRSTWSGLDRPVSRNLRSASRSVDRYLDDIQSTRSKFSSSFLKGWDSWIDDVVSNFRKGFDKLPGYAQSSMKDIISRLNKGISGINSTISNFGGDKKLSTISYANGTNGGHPGGHMLVNDSVRPHWKELVLFPNGQALLPQHRNTLIPNAPRGTQVLSGESTYKFMNSIGVHKYANGTLSESEMDKLSEQFEKHPEEAAKTLILKMTNWDSRVPLVADLGPASAIAFAKAISNVLKDQMASEANPGGAGVARWRPYIIRAFHALGYDAAEWKVNKLLKQIDTESGGNPTIPQQVHDKNSGGNESLGLLQFALSTWNADALPGHKNRASGYDQILAAINVLEHGGEGGWGNVGMGHGWATGGFATKHGLYEVAEEGLPEAIIPLDVNKRPRALSLIDHTLDKMEQDGGGTGGLRSRRVQSQSNDETTAYLKQAVTFLAQIVGLNKQQIDAILANGGNDDIRSRHVRQRFYQQYGNDQRVSDYMSY
ncbi:phage tail tape measure protein [Limosilactobacillus reuteri]|uniref:phage tail tape measure protein n=1 Tax=Limosilactobacillus reuteri TaxID=1598 RepID=UPI00081BD3E0|nr:phage tail tape measure protein [Limosilactobacillus reuteri]OCW61563.1 phage tail tape measure protein [Limosilactobacillus reuteri]OCW63104.1 phage tail tape measure protein [Limosilactobacillus reuteri]OCW63313.1 phage tail tape measure protein [Limosilactobacillus reuteri]OCW69038.1 phage tail tape measure protein [Limosilactobacillus reuteri]